MDYREILLIKSNRNTYRRLTMSSSKIIITTKDAPPNKIVLVGNTYEHKDDIKSRFNGGWNSKLKGWIIDKELTHDVVEWIASLPQVTRVTQVRKCSVCGKEGHTKTR